MTDSIRGVIVDLDDYTPNSATHQYLSDIPIGARVATSSPFTAKSVTDGVADAADLTITGVTGDVSEALVVYQDTGVATTSRLICFLDSAAGFPIYPNGGNVVVVFSSAPERIFRF
ncbi:hypothetical protein JRC04_04775 [Mycolicibacterium sp. S2-37]|nr:hypothetical protein [Mycolicibacterium sp. S2-37]